METSFADVVAALSAPSGHVPGVGAVKVIQTHASVVFLAGPHVYKIKKPVDFGFLDYSTLGRREQMCRAEVELNRRLAPDVYVGVVPVTRAGGHLTIDGPGEIVEWAVVMQRLPAAASWSTMVARGELEPAHVRAVGQVLARFHRDARRGPEIAAWGAYDHLARQCRDNFTALATLADDLDARVLDRLRAATDRELTMQRGTIQRRVRAGVPCEIHGDLRLEHVYDLGARGRPEDIRIVDCIEFSEQLRHGDPAGDLAFLAMDLRMHGAWSLADELVDAWIEGTGDTEARELLPLMSSYRSAVRAKVRALQARDGGQSPSARDELRALAHGHVLLALGELASAGQRPCLVLVAGLPGTGKSRLAADLERVAGMTWIRADAVRKQLAGLDDRGGEPAAIDGGIYPPAWNDRTYGECLAIAQRVLAAGGRALVDASFKEDPRRRDFIALARRMGVPVRILCCRASEAIVRERLAVRRDDPSDADWTVYEHARRTWDPFASATAPLVATLDAGGSAADTLTAALDDLRAYRLADPPPPPEVVTVPWSDPIDRALASSE
ncbi:MAG TPA: AAA family ATPase [Nannocystaceae bacterium]|nr:AAA family ATPase [Nannocystaceae bacterium]